MQIEDIVSKCKGVKEVAAEGEEPTTDYGEGGWAGIQELPNLNKPVIAAINGICCGGGLEWALSCDIIIAAEHASFALPEIKSGIIADAATIKLPKRIPYHIAMELLFTGRWIDAQTAQNFGLINKVVSPEKLNKAVMEIANKILKKSYTTIATGKKAFYHQLELGISKAYDFTSEVMAENMIEYNAQEGVEAFLQKRSPIWKD